MLFQNRTQAGEKLAPEAAKLAPIDPLVRDTEQLFSLADYYRRFQYSRMMT